MGQPGWSGSEKFGTVIGRKEHEDELDALIGEWTKERTAEEDGNTQAGTRLDKRRRKTY